MDNFNDGATEWYANDYKNRFNKMIPTKLTNEIPTINNHHWKNVGERSQNSVLNRELYVKGWTKKYMKKALGVKFECNNFMFINPALFLDIDEFNEFKKEFIGKINKEEGYYRKVVNNFKRSCKQFKTYCKSLLSTDFEDSSNERLLAIFNTAAEQFLYLVPFVFINHNEEEIPKELLNNILSKRNIPEDRFDLYNSELIISLGEKTHFEQEKEDLQRIARIIKKNSYNINKLPEDIIQFINYHIKNYCWIKSKYFSVKEVTFEEILERLTKYIEIDFEEQDHKEKEKHKQQEQRFNEIIKKWNIADKEIEIITLLRELLFLKTYRKELISLFSYSMGLLISELARRGGMGHREFINQTLDEINIFFENGTINKKEIEARLQGFSHIIIDGKISVISGINYDSLKKISGIDEIKGTTGYKGCVRGRVKIVKDETELRNIKDGLIIVLDFLSPNGTQYLHNPKGLITNHGGVLSHAAIISRELGIPCLIGTQNATQVFNDNDELELDADKGVARKVK